MAQLLPVIGAAVGAIANYKLVAELGNTAMNCFRMRIMDKTGRLES
jgi:TPR repeat protein